MTLRTIHRGCLLAVLLLTVVLYWPSLHYSFLSWDDQGHLTENRQVRSLSPSNIQSIFSSQVNQTYIPLTILSFAVEHHFSGLNPAVYHTVNVLLHVTVVFLLYIFSLRLGCVPWTAWMAAAIFAFHPMHVESVVWITQRKDVLYSAFYLAGLIAYIEYLKNKKMSWYAAVVLCGLLSILSKPMALSYPLILILIDRWFDRRLSRRALIEKIPIVLIMASVAGVTYAMNMRPVDFHFPHSFLTWIWCFWFYISQFFYPNDLLVLYQLPKPVTLSNPEFYIPLVATLSVLVLVYRLRVYKCVWFAFLYYVCSIFFLLRFDDVRDLTFVADRFMYLPSAGFCIGIGCVVQALKERCARKKVLRWSVLAGMMVVSGILYKSAMDRVADWKSEDRLWTQVVNHSASAVALTQLGNFYLNDQRDDKAAEYYQKAIALNAKYSKPYSNYGMILIRQGNLQEALQLFSFAIGLEEKPSAVLLANRGYTYMQMGMNTEALSDLNEAIATDPYYVPAYLNRATVFKNLKMYDASLKDLFAVLALDQDNLAARNNIRILQDQNKNK